MLSIFAAIFYLAVSAMCFAACKTTNQHTRSFRSPSWHCIAFLALAGFFACLALCRILSVEDLLRVEVREAFRGFAAYEGRRAWQATILATAASLIAVSGFWVAVNIQKWHLSSPDRILMGALAAGAAMLLLVAVRLISHHGVDRVLYDFKLNWILDLGLSIAVMISAVLYRRDLQSRTATLRKVRPRVQLR